MTNSTPPRSRRPGQDKPSFRDSAAADNAGAPGKPGGFGSSGPARPGRPNRPDRFDRADRPNRPGRSPYGRPDGPGRSGDAEDPDRPAAPRPPRGAGIIAEVCELDRDLLRLIARRARLLAKLPARQSGSGNADNERELRLSWEKHAARVSRDPRLIRQLFALLREVEVAPANMEQPAAFNLAPSRKPLELDLPAPVSDRKPRMVMALAAASGSAVELHDVPLNNPVIECLKMLNQVGASLRWEDDGRIVCREAAPVAGFGPGQAGRPGTVLDKVVHAGDDALNLYLLLFLMCTRPARLKIIGEGELKLADLAPLRRFLPRLGARLTAVIPGREGLPARLESSALLPPEVDVPADLPPDAALALCLSAPFRDGPAVLRLGGRPDAGPILDEALPLLLEAGVTARREADSLHVTPGKTAFRTPPACGVHLPAALTFLAMPALVGGTARLRIGADAERTPAEEARFAGARALLDRAGLILEEKEDALLARPGAGTGRPPADEPADVAGLPADLFPLGLALALIPAVRGGKGRLPRLPDGVDMALVDDFLLQLGLTRRGEAGGELEAAPESPAPAPWAAPTASWALALALAAFLRPHIKLSNPGIVTAALPDFWAAYNTLPAPTLRPKAPEAAPAPAKPARRRVIADSMPESERPEPLPFDEDD